MNIKSKLIEQLGVLENLQTLATQDNQFETARRIAETIFDCVQNIGELDDEPDYICPDCEESMLKEMIHQDIANACDLPIELVNRVMAGQDEVLGIND